MTGESEGKELGLLELIAIGVGGMIGGGIFSVLGLAVDVSGHAAPLAFLMGSLIALVAGYSYVRLALRYRDDGASFTYLERAFPKQLWVAGLAGWTVVIGYIGTLSLYAFTFGAYTSHLFGFDGSQLARALLSAGSLLLFLAINLIGAAAMGRAEDIAVYIMVLLLAILAAVGLTTADRGMMTPFLDHGADSILLGGALIFVAYEGFQLITNAVTEMRDPERNLPRGLYGSIAITSVIYMVIAFVAVGNLSGPDIHAAGEYALAAVAQPLLGRVGTVLVDIAAMLATASAINATVFGASRLTQQMATESLAPKVFAFRNQANVPKTAAIVITGCALALTALGSLELIASFSSLTFLLVSIGVCIANLRLRQETGAKPLPILLGILLMAATVILLLIYQAKNHPDALWFALATYATAAVAFFVFQQWRPKEAVSR